MSSGSTMRQVFFFGLLLAPLACGGGCGDDLPADPPATGTSGTTCASGCADTTAGANAPGTTSSSTGAEPPGTTSGGSTSGPSTVGIPDECAVSADCPDGGFCVAPFVPEFGPEGKQPSECVSECVVLMDELRWCFDAVACCDPDAVCTDRGYCELPDEESSGEDGGSSSSGGSDSSG